MSQRSDFARIRQHLDDTETDAHRGRVKNDKKAVGTMLEHEDERSNRYSTALDRSSTNETTLGWHRPGSPEPHGLVTKFDKLTTEQSKTIRSRPPKNSISNSDDKKSRITSSSSGDLVTALYQHCRVLLALYLDHGKAIETQKSQRQQFIKQCLTKLTLWGDDLDDDKLEQCLNHSKSLYISILEVLNSLGNVLVLKEAQFTTEPFLYEQERCVHEMHSKLNASNHYLLQNEPDQVVAVADNSAHDSQVFSLKKGDVFERVKRYIDLLLQLAPQLDLMSDDELDPGEYHDWPTQISTKGKAKASLQTIENPYQSAAIDAEPICKMCRGMSSSNDLDVSFCWECNACFCLSCWFSIPIHDDPTVTHEMMDPTLVSGALFEPADIDSNEPPTARELFEPQSSAKHQGTDLQFDTAIRPPSDLELQRSKIAAYQARNDSQSPESWRGAYTPHDTRRRR